MKIEKLSAVILIIVMISSISVTANIEIKQNTFIDPTRGIIDKTLPDVTKFNSVWVEYTNGQIQEKDDFSHYYLYQDQSILQNAESIDLTGLIIQITESTVTDYIQALTDFGPRVTGSSACYNAGDYIAGVFYALGLDVRIQEWSYGSYHGNNIEATLEGENQTSDEVYLVCGHYDTVSGSPGADDNAAGTAAVLASAKIMSNYMFSHTVKFVAFSGEEQGLLGSSVYAAEASSEGINIVEVLNADMIGYAETDEDRHNIGIYGSSTIASYSQAISDFYTGLIDLTVIPHGASANSDHWPFMQNGYDAAMYHEYHFNPYYHSSQDTMDKMDLEYDGRVTRMIMGTLANFSKLIIPDDDDGGGGYILRPSVNIEDPSNGEYVRETIDIKGKASDLNGYIKYVLVQIDDNNWDYAEIDQTHGRYINWTYTWDTTQFDDGSHLISAASINNHGADSPTYYSQVNVINEVLGADIIMPDQGNVNEMVAIQSFAIGGLPPYDFTWDLGDGTKKYEQNITHTYTYPGEYKVELTVKDTLNNSVYASKNILILDEIPPMIGIVNPTNALYLNNNELFALKNPIIIGDIDIVLDASDNIGISYVTIYVNNQEKHKFTDSPYVWTWDETMFGKATINVVVFDISGNKAEDMLVVWKFF